MLSHIISKPEQSEDEELASDGISTSQDATMRAKILIEELKWIAYLQKKVDLCNSKKFRNFKISLKIEDE